MSKLNRTLDSYLAHPSNKQYKYNPYGHKQHSNVTNTSKPDNLRQLKITTKSSPKHFYLTPSVDKDNTLTWIYFTNINGLTTHPTDKITEIIAFMKEHRIDIFGLAETNRHWNNRQTYNIYMNTIKKTERSSLSPLYL